jgi:hypothetical protein
VEERSPFFLSLDFSFTFIYFLAINAQKRALSAKGQSERRNHLERKIPH